MDPRVKTSAAGLEKKFQNEVRLSSLLDQTSRAVLQAGLMRDVLQKLSQQATGWVRDPIQIFQNKVAAVVGASSPAPNPAAITLATVNGQVGVLYGQVWQADAEPTSSQLDAIRSIEHDANDVLKRWDAVKADLPTLNRDLKQANLPEVKLEENPTQADDGDVDEE
jgi:hypothetical protein